VRTNLTNATAASRSASPFSATLATGLVASFVIVSLAAFTLGQRAVAAELNGPAKAAGCYRPDDLQSKLFPNQDIVAYDFKGTDASKLKNVMDGVSKAVTSDVILVRVVLVPATDDAFAFQFGADGCRTAMIGLDFSHMSTLFESAGVSPPFGATFYQITGRAI
jgi:hypothetical protein